MENKKIDATYTKSIGRNLDEKVLPWKDYLDQEASTALKILDIGSAGGEFIEQLSKITHDSHEIWAVDLSEEYVALSSRVVGGRSKLGNACSLPFENDFFDAINCSSLLHEVFTYGYEGLVGLEALFLSIKEVKRVLKTGGYFFYRDVLAPDTRSFSTQSYRTKSLKFFIDLFLKEFANSAPLIYKDNYVFKEVNGSYVLFGNAFLHREIQKHYLLCLDNISSTIFSLNGVSDTFESKTSRFQFLEQEFSNAIELQHEILTAAVNNWLSREGVEKYTYLTVNELLKFCTADLEKSGYTLIATGNPESYSHLRNQENDFLNSILDNPESEGKQVITFRKVEIVDLIE